MARNLEKVKQASVSDDMAALARTGNRKNFDEWGKFIELANEQKKTRGHSKDDQTFVWIDKDITKMFERMKVNGLEYPVRYMINAALRVFIEANQQSTEKYLSK